ncbi:uncharacterized protein LOC103314615 [Tribolium castaneum]|uniref:ZAD domain-containing protein n=1 Tax=Tribolium castaneum TaxID=7070 RepID=D6WIK4_TRICA|nr:PREDICTED: uncharacterized protein LOC103314615 [Tribolium castaneum]EEZ99652.1 hypothetical protein TcasGA2_TC002409 [Tribolium castaneum]|eukprot:XP_008199286.1 PREDICTED: uncharacterized protein LOC103314615 [Tribolium castaneum]
MDICRLCSSKPEICYNIFKKNIVNMISALTNNQIEPYYEGVSAWVCVKCFLNLKMAYNFQQKILKNEQLLLDRVTQQSEENTCDEKVVINDRDVVKLCEETTEIEEQTPPEIVQIFSHIRLKKITKNSFVTEKPLITDEPIKTELCDVKCDITVETEDVKCEETMATNNAVEEPITSDEIKSEPMEAAICDKSATLVNDSRDVIKACYSHLGETPPEIKKLFSIIRSKKITKNSFVPPEPVKTTTTERIYCKICQRVMTKLRFQKHRHKKRRRGRQPDKTYNVYTRVKFHY